MKPSIALGLKSFVSKIHPPLPMNPRESQKLLNLLTDSFRRQLDLKHAKPTPTDAHIDSILSSPLLNPKERRKQSPWRSRRDVNALEEVQSSLLLTTPAEYFDNQVASGQASLETARLCLNMELQNAGRSKDSIKLIAESKASASVLHWLWSSGLEESLRFVHDGPFMDDLMPFMVIQGNEYRVMRWIRQLAAPLKRPSPEEIEDSDGMSSEAAKIHTDQEQTTHSSYLSLAVSRPLKALIKAKIKYRSINSAVQAFFDVVKGNDLTMASSSQISIEVLKLIIRPVVARGPSSTGLDIKLYDRLLFFCNGIRSLESYAARLAQQHPTHPDATQSLRLFQSRSWKEEIPLWPTRKRISFANSCLRTAKVLLATGKESDAKWVMNFVQDNFPDEIGVDMTQKARARRGEHFSDCGILQEPARATLSW